eukprot:COSAG02_NODE_7799_length_2841_cov_1.997812_2_plen_171_part_00
MWSGGGWFGRYWWWTSGDFATSDLDGVPPKRSIYESGIWGGGGGRWRNGGGSEGVCHYNLLMPTIGSENWSSGVLWSRRRDPRGCSATVEAATAFGRQAMLWGVATGAIDAARAWALLQHGMACHGGLMDAFSKPIAPVVTPEHDSSPSLMTQPTAAVEQTGVTGTFAEL